MKLVEFYRCMRSGEKFHALRTLGYVEGGIGLVKETKGRGWVATHIPTGTKITPDSSNHKTAKQALLEAEKLIAKSEDILAVIQRLRNTKGYNAFVFDRNRQLLVEETYSEELPF